MKLSKLNRVGLFVPSTFIVVLSLLACLALHSCKDDSSEQATLPTASHDVFASEVDFSNLGDLGLVYTSVGDGNIFLRYEYFTSPNYSGLPLQVHPTFTFTKGNTGTYYIDDLKLVPISESSTGFVIEGMDGPLKPGSSNYEALIGLMGKEVTIRNVLENGTENFSEKIRIPPLPEPLEVESTPSQYGERYLATVDRNAVVSIGDVGGVGLDVALSISYIGNPMAGQGTNHFTRVVMYENASRKLQLTPEVFEGMPKGGRVRIELQVADAAMLTGENGYSYFVATILEGSLPYLLLGD